MEKFYSCSIESPIANYCTMYTEGEKTLGIIQQRYSSKTKHTWWGPLTGVLLMIFSIIRTFLSILMIMREKSLK